MAAVVATVAAGGSTAAPTATGIGSPCPGGGKVRCLSVTVPLDRAGKVPGTVPIHVQVLPATGPQRGVVFLLAGGPGQAGTKLFDLRTPIIGQLFGAAFPDYTLVSYDIRGTGGSGRLRCPKIDTDTADNASTVARCAEALGPRRDFYGTADHAEDLEAVRAKLGYGSIALSGVSYGTELAVAYARAHPKHVERMLLDSVALLDRPDPYVTRALSAVPPTLRRYCADGACKAATPDYAADIAALARSVELKPIRGTVLRANGSHKTVTIDKHDLLAMVLSADIAAGLAVELPAAARAARLGNPAPLLRLNDLASGEVSSLLEGHLSDAVFLATICRDGRFPWQPGATISQRKAVVDRAISGLTRAQLGGFGTWAARIGTATLCLGWPTRQGGLELATGPLPDVPVLALSGGADSRTPTANAVELVSRFKRGRLLVVPGVGHSVLTNDPSGCAIGLVGFWVRANRLPTTRCPRPDLYFFGPLAAFASKPATTPVRPASPERTLEIVGHTIRDAQALWLLTVALDGGGTTVAGITHGKALTSIRTLQLTGYAIEPGVHVSGRLTLSAGFSGVGFKGTVRIDGPGAAKGTLSVDRDELRGTLGGEPVG